MRVWSVGQCITDGRTNIVNSDVKKTRKQLSYKFIETSCSPRTESSDSLFYKVINNLAIVPHSCLERRMGVPRKNIIKVSAQTLIHIDNSLQ